MQSKTHSIIESLTNVAVGYIVALISQILVFPLYGINVPITTNLMIGLWFTIISIIRSYVLRRWFTRKTETHWNWQPMSKAPRDGTVVDLINKDGHRQTDVWWTDDECWSDVTDDSFWVAWLEPPRVIPYFEDGA